MSTNDTNHLDPDDMFSDTRMSFGDHIEDLRTHLLRALKCLLIGMILSIYPIAYYVLQIITDPVEKQLKFFQERKHKRETEAKRLQLKDVVQVPITQVVMINADEWRQKLGFPALAPRVTPEQREPVLDKLPKVFEQFLVDLDAIHLLDENVRNEGAFVQVKIQIVDPFESIAESQRRALEMQKHSLSTMHITEAFMVYFKVAFMTGLVLSSPWVFYHIWMFIAAGLYPQEKKLVNVYLPFSLVLFIGGVLVCQFLVMPKAVEAMLWFNEWLGLSADLRLNEWLGFALMMPIVFGVSFQTPLVMMFLHRVGIVGVQTYRDKRRIAWFAMAVFAALITPSIDPISMCWLWVPMGGLYELGILICVWQGEQDTLAEWEEEEKSNELVEV